MVFSYQLSFTWVRLKIILGTFQGKWHRKPGKFYRPIPAEILRPQRNCF